MEQFYLKKHADKALYYTLCMQLLTSFIIAFIPTPDVNAAGGFLVLMLKYVFTELSFLIAFYGINKLAKSSVNWKSSLGINKKSNVCLLLLAMLSGILFFVLSYHFFGYADGILLKIGFKNAADPFVLNSWWKFIVSIIPLAVMPAICEELIYRGIVLQGLAQNGKVKAILLSSVLFAFMHMGVFQLFYQLILAMLFAVVVLLTKDIKFSISMHLTNNFLVLLFEFLNKKYGFTFYFFQKISFWLACVLFVIALALIGLIIYIIKRKTKTIDGYCSKGEISKEENIRLNISLIFILSMYVALAILNSLVA